MNIIDLITIAAGLATFFIALPVLAGIWNGIARAFDRIDAAEQAALGRAARAATAGRHWVRPPLV